MSLYENKHKSLPIKRNVEESEQTCRARTLDCFPFLCKLHMSTGGGMEWGAEHQARYLPPTFISFGRPETDTEAGGARDETEEILMNGCTK